jgi:hypothetical protein
MLESTTGYSRGAYSWSTGGRKSIGGSSTRGVAVLERVTYGWAEHPGLGIPQRVQGCRRKALARVDRGGAIRPLIQAAVHAALSCGIGDSIGAGGAFDSPIVGASPGREVQAHERCRSTGSRSREGAQAAESTDYLRKHSAGLFRSQPPQDDVDCEALVGKFFRLDGEEWEVIEADASSGLAFLVVYIQLRYPLRSVESSTQLHLIMRPDLESPRQARSIELLGTTRVGS